MRIFSTIFFLIVCFTISGCVATQNFQQMYSGEPLPPDQTARIRGIGEVKLTLVDGADVGLSFLASSNTAVVLPGRHVVEGTYIPNSSLKLSVETFSLEFVAKAGTDYFIESSFRSRYPQIFEDPEGLKSQE